MLSCLRSSSTAKWRRREEVMKFLIGAIVAFLVGAGCRYFDIPVPSPPVLPGALLVVAMTLGYSAADRVLGRKASVATTKHLCGGPTGITVASEMKRETRSAASN
jgi:XapX domain-containing protein